MHAPIIILGDDGQPQVIYPPHKGEGKTTGFQILATSAAAWKKFKKSSVKNIADLPVASAELVTRAKTMFDLE